MAHLHPGASLRPYLKRGTQTTSRADGRERKAEPGSSIYRRPELYSVLAGVGTCSSRFTPFFGRGPRRRYTERRGASRRYVVRQERAERHGNTARTSATAARSPACVRWPRTQPGLPEAPFPLLPGTHAAGAYEFVPYAYGAFSFTSCADRLDSGRRKPGATGLHVPSCCYFRLAGL